MRLSDFDDWAHPHRYATGFEYVLVNGVPVIDGSEHTGARPGRTVHYS